MTEYAKKLLRLYHEQGKKDRMIEGSPPLSFTSGSPGNLKNYRIFGNSVEQVISNNLFYKVISGAGMQTDGTIKSDSSYNMLFAKIIPGQDYIAAKGEVNSTALTYTLYNVYDHDPDIGSQALLPSWKSTNNNGIINYTGDTPVYLGLRVPASTAFPHLNIGTTIYDYDEYEASITGVGDKVTDSQYLIPVTITNGADTQTTNLYLPEPLKMVGDEAEYIDYREQKMHKVRKNLWSGVVEQGNVSQSGVYGSDNKRIRSKNVPIEPGTYMISSNVLIRIIYAYNDDQKIDVCLNSAAGVYSWSFTVPTGANNIAISMMKRDANVQVDITPSDFIWGQIEKGSEATTYEPYIEDTELDVTLPALPTLSGTNTLSVGTEVQPSKVYIKCEFKKITTTYVQSIEPDNTNNKIIFVVRAYRSNNDRMVRAGLVATNDPAIGVNINVNSTVITSGCKVFVKEVAGVTPTTDNIKYTWTKTKVTDGEIWYVRSYEEYINSDNEQLIIYSDAAKASLDGII